LTITSVYALLFALFLLGILLYLFFHRSGRMFYFLFIFGVISSSLLLSDFSRPMQECCSSQTFPFTLPLLYLIGPSYLFYKNGYRYQAGWMWLHFSPAILLLLTLAISAIIQPEYFIDSLALFTLGESTHITGLSWLSDKTVIYLYPIHTLVYLIMHIKTQVKEGVALVSKDELTTYAMVFNTPLILVIIAVFTGILEVSDLTLAWFQVLVISIIPVLIVDLLNGYQSAEQKNRIDTVLRTLDMAHISLYIGGQITPKSAFTTTGFTKENLIDLSAIPESEWNEYFLRKGLTFISLKRWIRVQIAKKLIAEGYLVTYSVEALSIDIGYQSRSSFYSAFKQTEGITFMEYRERIKKEGVFKDNSLT